MTESMTLQRMFKCELWASHALNHSRRTLLQWDWHQRSHSHLSTDCKSQRIQQYVVEDKEEEDQKEKERVYNLQWTWHCYDVMKKEELISSTVLYSLSETCDQPYSSAVLCDYSTWTLTQLLYMLICILFYWNKDYRQVLKSIDTENSVMRREMLCQSYHIISITVQHYDMTL